MAFQSCPGTAELFTEFRMPDNSIGGNVWHFYYSGGGIITSVALEALATTWRSLWTTHVRPEQSSGVALTRLSARSLETQNGPIYEEVLNPPLAGTSVSAPMPNNVTLAIKLGTNSAGRSNRGRLYHIGLTETQVTGNFVGDATAAALVTRYNAIRAGISTGTDFFWGVLTRYADGELRPFGITNIIQLVSVVDRRIDTQRGRMPKLHN